MEEREAVAGVARHLVEEEEVSAVAEEEGEDIKLSFLAFAISLRSASRVRSSSVCFVFKRPLYSTVFFQ